jgi:hypothetical protein
MNERGYNITDIKMTVNFFLSYDTECISVTIQTNSATHKFWLIWMNQHL